MCDVYMQDGSVTPKDMNGKGGDLKYQRLQICTSSVFLRQSTSFCPGMNAYRKSLSSSRYSKKIFDSPWKKLLKRQNDAGGCSFESATERQVSTARPLLSSNISRPLRRHQTNGTEPHCGASAPETIGKSWVASNTSNVSLFSKKNCMSTNQEKDGKLANESKKPVKEENIAADVPFYYDIECAYPGMVTLESKMAVDKKETSTSSSLGTTQVFASDKTIKIENFNETERLKYDNGKSKSTVICSFQVPKGDASNAISPTNSSAAITAKIQSQPIEVDTTPKIRTGVKCKREFEVGVRNPPGIRSRAAKNETTKSLKKYVDKTAISSEFSILGKENVASESVDNQMRSNDLSLEKPIEPPCKRALIHNDETQNLKAVQNSVSRYLSCDDGEWSKNKCKFEMSEDWSKSKADPLQDNDTLVTYSGHLSLPVGDNNNEVVLRSGRKVSHAKTVRRIPQVKRKPKKGVLKFMKQNLIEKIDNVSVDSEDNRYYRLMLMSLNQSFLIKNSRKLTGHLRDRYNDLKDWLDKKYTSKETNVTEKDIIANLTYYLRYGCGIETCFSPRANEYFDTVRRSFESLRNKQRRNNTAMHACSVRKNGVETKMEHSENRRKITKQRCSDSHCETQGHDEETSSQKSRIQQWSGQQEGETSKKECRTKLSGQKSYDRQDRVVEIGNYEKLQRGFRMQTHDRQWSELGRYNEDNIPQSSKAEQDLMDCKGDFMHNQDPKCCSTEQLHKGIVLEERTRKEKDSIVTSVEESRDRPGGNNLAMKQSVFTSKSHGIKNICEEIVRIEKKYQEDAALISEVVKLVIRKLPDHQENLAQVLEEILKELTDRVYDSCSRLFKNEMSNQADEECGQSYADISLTQLLSKMGKQQIDQSTNGSQLGQS